MENKALGGTEVQVPEIGLGTWAYKGGTEPLRKGISLGAFLIDTAEAYGTEDSVGKAVADMRDEVFLATKVSPIHFKPNDVIKAANRSLKQLGIDYIDLYQLHWSNPGIPVEDTMGAMDSLVADGKVRFIGVSNFSVSEFRDAQAVTANKIVSNQVRYNLVDRAIESELLPFCRENGVTVIAYSPLALNIATIRSGLRDGALETVARETGKTEAQVALNWCILKDDVVAIPKSDSVQRTAENCASSGWRLSREHVQLLEGDGSTSPVSTS
jgi:diketogulonate reductase-like aldo/keto reductase